MYITGQKDVSDSSPLLYLSLFSCVKAVALLVSSALFFMDMQEQYAEVDSCLASHFPGGSMTTSWQGCQKVFSRLPHNYTTCKCTEAVSDSSPLLFLTSFTAVESITSNGCTCNVHSTAGGMCFVYMSTGLYQHTVSLPWWAGAIHSIKLWFVHFHLVPAQMPWLRSP